MRKLVIAAIALSAIALSAWLLNRRAAERQAKPPVALEQPEASTAGPVTGPSVDGFEQTATRSAHPDPETGIAKNHSADDTQGLSPVESALLTQGMVNDRANDTLVSEHFDDFMVSLQAAKVSDAGERSSAYRIEVEESLQRHPELGTLDRFACGGTFCAGSINIGTKRKELQAWANTLQGQATLPIPAFSYRLIASPDGSTEARFLFTTRGTGGFITSGKRR